MKEEQYLTERLEKQITWYSKKSKKNQRWFQWLRIIEIISAGIIPFLAGRPSMAYSEWLIGGLGILVAVSAAVIALFKYQENWLEYRTTAEQLKHEKYLYLTNVKPYDADDKFSLLVDRVESLISRENSAWADFSRNAQKSHDTKK
ncbi:MAG: DUF4231 domain-containing protein [Candidatus Electrothrix sp. AR3]|nr:DUF4231 domain-containing protein [Candidatus Electrothrix sp. AR3]